MTDSLYDKAIIEAGKDGTAAGRLDDPDGTATADNPLCGDRVIVDLRAENGTITEISHRTRGCLLTKAAAALLARHVKGRPLAEAPALQARAKAYLEGESGEPPFAELAVMAPVKAVKSRHDCVTIAFDALADAAAQANEDQRK
jgi:nitrogen fixation NifU-like protein